MPAIADAAPHHNHGLTIAATPDPIIAGDAVLIYGQLNTKNPGGQTIVLYHRINPRRVFTVISTTTTKADGFYEFNRPTKPVTDLSVVMSNRSWFVTAPGLPGNIHSRTAHEHVAATVTLATPAAPTAGYLTGQPVTFTGSVAPDHAGDRVLLQQQVGIAGDSWKTIKGGRLDSASQFTITHRFKIPGDHAVRVLFRRDARNIAAASDPITVIVQQKERPDFTINTSAPIVDEGTQATISGALNMAGTTTPASSAMVTLFGQVAGQAYEAVGTTLTGTDGSYSFAVSPVHNEEYQVRTTFAPARASTRLFEGVRDVLSINASSLSSAVGQSVTFTGSVSPDKAGHAIELQRLGADGRYHIVSIGFVNVSSAYKLDWTFGSAGTKTFRVYIPGGPDNVAGVSTPVAISVTLPAVMSLPPAS